MPGRKAKKNARGRKRDALANAERVTVDAMLEERLRVVREIQDEQEARLRGLELAQSDATTIRLLEAAREGLTIQGIEDYAMVPRGALAKWERESAKAKASGDDASPFHSLAEKARLIRSVKREFEIRIRRRLQERGSVPALLGLLARSDDGAAAGRAAIQVNQQVNTGAAGDGDSAPGKARRGVSPEALQFVIDGFLMGPHTPDESEYIDTEGEAVGDDTTQAD